MTIEQSLFVVFFAIFWGAVASVHGRWKMFHWPLICFPHARRRLVLSFIVLNILPVLFFAWVFYLLRHTPAGQVSDWTFRETLMKVSVGVVPAFAVFGFYRLWLAAVELSPDCFYQTSQQLDASIRGIEPTVDELKIKGERWLLNFLFAVLYLTVALIFAHWSDYRHARPRASQTQGSYNAERNAT